jgi:hypothetical protein
MLAEWREAGGDSSCDGPRSPASRELSIPVAMTVNKCVRDFEQIPAQLPASKDAPIEDGVDVPPLLAKRGGAGGGICSTGGMPWSPVAPRLAIPAARIESKRVRWCVKCHRTTPSNDRRRRGCTTTARRKGRRLGRGLLDLRRAVVLRVFKVGHSCARTESKRVRRCARHRPTTPSNAQRRRGRTTTARRKGEEPGEASAQPGACPGPTWLQDWPFLQQELNRKE